MTNAITNFSELSTQIKEWGQALGFQQLGITDVDLSQAESRLQAWLDRKFHGEMAYMQNHGIKRSRPQELVPGTLRVITARMDYLAPGTESETVLQDPKLGYVARYALGRDYHKVLRKRLTQLAEKIKSVIQDSHYRVFTDSAPVMEKPLAEKAGLGWIGKHTNLINARNGSWFFLGCIYTDIPLLIDAAATNHCGSCQNCIQVCPTQAIVGPYQLDARRCISYLTIEFKGSIPEELRPLMGNRIYGCDDCQIFCPWNKFAKLTAEKDFQVRHGLDAPQLLELFAWSEEEFLKNTEGSAMRRVSYLGWLRNIAVALGNAPYDPKIIDILHTRAEHPSTLVREHVAWALQQQQLKFHE